MACGTCGSGSCRGGNACCGGAATRYPKAINSIPSRPRPTVFIDADYAAKGNEEAIIALAGADGDTAAITVTLSDNTLPGVETRIVAAGRPVTVDGGANNVLVPTTVDLGTARVYTFAGPTAVDTPCTDPGTWVPDDGGTGA